MRTDLIDVYKRMNGFSKGDITEAVEPREAGRTCSNGFRLEKLRLNTDIVMTWYNSRLVDRWSKLVIIL